MAASKKSGRAAEESLIAFICCSLLGLLVLISVPVIEVDPGIPRLPDDLNQAVQRHKWNLYYYEAVTLAKGLQGSSATGWSHLTLDPEAVCLQLHHGIYEAEGTADVPFWNGLASHERWQILFLAESRKVLYFRLGSTEYGNYPAAVKAATDP